MAEGFILADEPRLFDRLEAQPSDSLLALIGLVKADTRPEKIDVGVGVYRDAAGGTPILRCVKAAEKILLETQETKAYLGSEGDARFTELIKPIVFGGQGARDDRIVGVQTPGGCGALRLGAELIRASGGGARVFVGQPTWPNHNPLIGAAGVEMVDYPYYDKASHTVLFDRMMGALEEARPGDLVLVHGCCHNPTGADLSLNQWRELADLIAARGIVPFVDLAYQGLGNGLEDDAAGTRLVVEAAEQALVAQSCDKNFGLYRERTGALFVKASSGEQANVVFGNLIGLARTMWSMPPDHGAAIVRTVLETPELEADWRAELKEMLARIRSLRARLATFDPRLAYIDEQNGMFSMLPLSPEAVVELRASHGIYMANSGRFNVAGLSDDNVDYFARAVVERLPEADRG
ncbi:amino acid aminotransferase [Sphingosinicella humi]|uniref:Aromatic amino acid aminotransferase n=1 Tax=Allosphingosinicella humi TaxID=2068657 RepID=A0A2U2IZL1_9SPHN|nr:amino acid aminotransferase [Sphingosinicella humi]PWG01508.1 aromatic amino acid aminotransferase [Sphingosinicella humi]